MMDHDVPYSNDEKNTYWTCYVYWKYSGSLLIYFVIGSNRDIIIAIDSDPTRFIHRIRAVIFHEA